MENIKNDIDAGKVYVLVKNNVIAATGTYTDNYITRVYVLPAFQKQGLGSYIMDKLEAEIFSKFSECSLDASLPACIFYENRGYHTVKHIRHDIGNGNFMIYETMRKECL